jgi:DNA-binding transcriptional regulator YdaS (Cro superfamily)
MTAEGFRASLAGIGWSERQLAAAIGCSQTLVNKYGRGVLAVPAPLAAWLERQAKAARDDPPPAAGR